MTAIPAIEILKARREIEKLKQYHKTKLEDAFTSLFRQEHHTGAIGALDFALDTFDILLIQHVLDVAYPDAIGNEPTKRYKEPRE